MQKWLDIVKFEQIQRLLSSDKSGFPCKTILQGLQTVHTNRFGKKISQPGGPGAKKTIQKLVMI